MATLEICHTGPLYSGSSAHSDHSDAERQMAWERGEIDYTGSDRFTNIRSKLDDALKLP
ncbi:unnamed protein product [Protopolystoma xenopodis]|uniref:Uncharacterized protein n=1 Tax=Protopolystoma xenopodis TaxID=117903 RepID=A0A448WMP0_9PLAT|nr:unnamed protein product [Protopolystoma xenopodis]